MARELNSNIHEQLSRNIALALRAKVRGVSESLGGAVNYLSNSELISDRNAIKSFFYSDIKSHKNTDAIFIGLPNEYFVGFLRRENQLYFMEALPENDNTIEFYLLNEQGKPVQKVASKAGFRPTTRSWYKDASLVNTGVWGDLFQYYALEEIVVPKSHAIYDESNNVIAVLGVNLFVSELNQLLQQLNYSDKSTIALLDENDNLIAHSLNDSVKSKEELINIQDNDMDFHRQKITLGTESLSWSILSALNKEEFFQPAFRQFILTESIAFGIILLLAMLTLLIIRKILRPINALINSVESYNKSNKFSDLVGFPINEGFKIKEIYLLFSAIQKLVRLAQTNIEHQEKLLDEKSELIDKNSATIRELTKLVNLIRQTDDAVAFFNTQGKLVWCNRAFESLSGLSFSEIEQRSILDLFPKGTLYSPITKQHLEKPTKRIISSTREDGKTIWYELVTHTFFDNDGEVIEYVTTQRDITKIVEHKEALENWEQVFNNASWGVALSRGLPPKIKEFNSKFCAMLEYPSEEMKDKPVLEIYGVDQEEKLKNIIKQVELKGAMTYEANLRKKNGEEFPALINLSSVYNAKGEVTARVANIHDLTQLRQVENQLLQAQKLQALGLLASGVVHDFNNILASIIVNAELAEIRLKSIAINSAEVDEVTQNLSSITKLSERAGEVAEQILLFSRKDKGKFAWITVDSILKDIFTIAKDIASSNIHLNSSVSPNNLSLYCKPIQIKQLLLNLITNAIESLQSKEQAQGVISIEASLVDSTDYIGLRKHNEWVKISVRDNGTGIPEREQSKIFEPFYTTKKEGDGTGLGLSIVNKVINEHKGIVRVSSEPNQFTQFDVYLPYTKEEWTSAKIESDKQPEIDFKGATILLVDDNKDVLSAYANSLRLNNAEVYATADSNQAITWIENHVLNPSVAILDQAMPIIKGSELARSIQKIHPACPILIISGYILDQEELNGISKVKVLKKPIKSFTLAEEIKAVL